MSHATASTGLSRPPARVALVLAAAVLVALTGPARAQITEGVSRAASVHVAHAADLDETVSRAVSLHVPHDGAAIAETFSRAVSFHAPYEGAVVTETFSRAVSFYFDNEEDPQQLVVAPDGSGDYPTIQAAVDAADRGAIIRLRAGRFTGPGNVDVRVVDTGLTIAGDIAYPGNVTIDAAGAARFFRVEGGDQTELTTTGLTLVGGAADTAAVYAVRAGRLDAYRCFVRASHGPALIDAAPGTRVSLNECLFWRDQMEQGAPLIRLAAGAELSLTGTSCVDNGGPVVVAEDAGDIAIARTVLAFNGAAPLTGTLESGATVTASCSDVFGNAGGDWVDLLAGLGASEGNISADPLYANPATGNLTYQPASPCLPDNNACEVLMGVEAQVTVIVDPGGGGDYERIQDAVDAVEEGTVIALADGVFTGERNRDIDPAGKNLVFRSVSGDADACIIDCEGSPEEPHRAFHFHSSEDSTTVVTGLTITGGWVVGDDGAGGGMLVENGAGPSLVDIIFTNNRAHSGGGGLHYGFAGAARRVHGLIFSANQTQSGGGGLHYEFAREAVVQDCVFVGNHAADGSGALRVGAGSEVRVANTTLADNTGPGLEIAGETRLIIKRSIIAFNGGVAVACDDAATATASCSDVYGNEGGDWVGCLEGQEGVDGNFSADPLFADLAGRDLSLLPDSPCLPDGNSCEVLIGAPLPEMPLLVPVTDQPPPPATLELAVYPNPFNPRTTIAFSLPAPQHVRLTLYDVAGRRVARLVDAPYQAGRHTVLWQGRDDRGRGVASGTYLVALRTETGRITQKLLLLR